jgi:hypothetical protein
MNPEFASRNNWWSVLLALRKLPDDDPVAIINSELLVRPEQLETFLADRSNEGLLATDLERP